MAAVETDKELNDLLDFSAVRSLLKLLDCCVTFILAVTQSKLECVDCFMLSVAVG